MIKLGSIIIPVVSGFDIAQTYDAINARTIQRYKDGGALVQSRYNKLHSTISASGWIPAPFDAIDSNQPIAVSCIAPLCVFGATTGIVIPRNYRTDSNFTGQAFALVGDEVVETAVSLVGQAATLTAVADAAQYQVIYYPIITGILTISQEYDDSMNVMRWTIDLEEE